MLVNDGCLILMVDYGWVSCWGLIVPWWFLGCESTQTLLTSNHCLIGTKPVMSPWGTRLNTLEPRTWKTEKHDVLLIAAS